ncbi:MAG: acyl-[acyl-carrier-protein] thioesterase [Porphyromonadaceae bacterium]|nr:acyl-[acyl-carrier-protein] thioesterase [Porphyromonadaceae bacterium]
MKKGRFTFEIEPQFVDFQHSVKLSYLIDLILTASGYNADENGFGIRDLNKIGATWVLSRFALEMDYFPKQYEKIHIETWVEEVHTLNTIRNYRVFNESGKVIGNSTSVWVMINLKTRRPMELKLLKGIDDFALYEASGIDRPLKIDAVEGEPFEIFSAKYTDIDINQHVNSVRYIDWMLNTFTLDEHKSKIVCRLDVNFMNEVLWGNQITIFKSEKESGDFRFEIKANERTACRGRVVF